MVRWVRKGKNLSPLCLVLRLWSMFCESPPGPFPGYLWWGLLAVQCFLLETGCLMSFCDSHLTPWKCLDKTSTFLYVAVYSWSSFLVLSWNVLSVSNKVYFSEMWVDGILKASVPSLLFCLEVQLTASGNVTLLVTDWTQLFKTHLKKPHFSILSHPSSDALKKSWESLELESLDVH